MKTGTYLGLIVTLATVTYVVVHLKISTILHDADTVTKMISNKYTSFRRKGSPTSEGTYISSSSSSSSTLSRERNKATVLSNTNAQLPSSVSVPASSSSTLTTSASTSAPTTTVSQAVLKDGSVKLYSDKHPILALPDKAFRETTLDTMMGWYDAAKGAKTCDDDFGNGLIRRWRATKAPFCTSTLSDQAIVSTNSDRSSASDSSSNRLESSHIDCYLIKQANHYGNGDNLCVMSNVSVNLGIFGDDSVVRSVVKTYVDTRHDDQPYVHFTEGFIQGACTPVADKWDSKLMPGWNADWTTSAFQRISDDKYSASGETRSICDEWIEHPVLIVQRDTFANFFHDSEDFFNVFIAMSVLQQSFDNIQIYLTDLYPKGPFWSIWEKVFSGKYAVKDAWDIRARFGRSPRHRVCFRDLTVGIYGPAAPITIHTWETPCRGTALVRAYSDFVIRGLNLQQFTHYAQREPSKTITVTYLARRASTVWPEKKYCNDTESFFLCELWKDWGIRSLGRMVDNDKELVSTLKGLETMVFKNGAHVIFQDVDFNLLSLEDQIKIDLQTDILVGPHGAGLMHNIFMRDRATLIELSVDGSGNLRHFYNLANWYGRNYVGLNVNNPIDVRSLFKTIIETIEKTPLDMF